MTVIQTTRFLQPHMVLQRGLTCGDAPVYCWYSWSYRIFPSINVFFPVLFFYLFTFLVLVSQANLLYFLFRIPWESILNFFSTSFSFREECCQNEFCKYLINKLY